MAQTPVYDGPIEFEYRPQLKTIQKWVEHLESLGLTVYGPNMDSITGEAFDALMDYTAEDIVNRQWHLAHGTMWYDSERTDG